MQAQINGNLRLSLLVIMEYYLALGYLGRN
jgi:hypothetical protein